MQLKEVSKGKKLHNFDTHMYQLLKSNAFSNRNLNGEHANLPGTNKMI